MRNSITNGTALRDLTALSLPYQRSTMRSKTWWTKSVAGKIYFSCFCIQEQKFKDIGNVNLVFSGTLEEAFDEVEAALFRLEDLNETLELQSRQLDHRFQLALYKEKKLSELDSTRGGECFFMFFYLQRQFLFENWNFLLILRRLIVWTAFLWFTAKKSYEFVDFFQRDFIVFGKWSWIIACS